jgi:hypothetical protein
MCGRRIPRQLELQPSEDDDLLIYCLRLRFELFYRPFQFNKRSQFLIRTHNRTFAVLTFCGHNPKLLAFVIRT